MVMQISTFISKEEAPSDDDRRASEFLEVILNDRADELLQWARLEMNKTSAVMMAGIKGLGQ